MKTQKSCNFSTTQLD